MRVTISTMVSESRALGVAFDRNLYARVLTQHMLYGNLPLPREWRQQLVVDGCLVTDAKSLFDHLGKSGGIPQERQVLLDLLAVRNAIEAGEVRTS